MALPNFYTKKQREEDYPSKEEAIKKETFNKKEETNLNVASSDTQRSTEYKEKLIPPKPPEVNLSEAKSPEIKKAFSPSNLGPNTSSISSVSTKPTVVEEILRRENKKKKILALSLIFIFLPVLAFGALYGTDNLYRVVGGLPRDPKKAIAIVTENMEKVKSVHIEGEMEMNFQAPGVFGISDDFPSSVKMKMSGDMAEPNKAKITMSITNIMTTDMIVLGDKLYMKMNPEMLANMKEDFSDSWFEMPVESEEAKDLLATQESFKWKSYDKFIKNTQTLAKTNRETHFKFDLDVEGVIEEPEFKKAFESSLSEKTGGVDISDIINFSDSVFSMETWVDNTTRLPNKDLFEMTLKSKDLPSKIESIKSGPLTIKAKIEVVYSDFNKEIAIEKPQNIIPYAEFSKLISPVTDDARKAHLGILVTYLKLYKDKTNGYPISQGLEKTNDKDSQISKALREKFNLTDELPIDPKDPQYFYGYKSDGKSYELTAVLENQNDSECRVEGNLCIYRIRDGEVVSKK